MTKRGVLMMDSLSQFGAKQLYERIGKLGDKLEMLSEAIDWRRFEGCFDRNLVRGRPAYDPVMMFKVLVLQSLYGLSDEECEYQIVDRLSFQRFLGFPKNVPDYSTIWRFREYISEVGVEEKLWRELQKQMDVKGIEFSKGVIQDASFIEANPGKTQSGTDNRGRGQPTTRNEDGTWSKKNGKSHFGYKLHTKVDGENGLITELAVTTASIHDNQIDLAKEDEIMYRDKGYFGAKTKAKGDATMKRAVRGHPLTINDKIRNIRISKTRSKGERPYAVLKNVMHGGKTLLTELHRVFTQQFICCFTYNLLQIPRLT